MSDAALPQPRPRIALALQGGGAHGAYGWGVIERLLEEDFDIVAVSGASAGALNGAALVAGYVAHGPAGANAGLERLWRAVSTGSPLAAFDFGPMGNPLIEAWVGQSLALAKLTSRYIAPFVPSLRDMRALRRIVAQTVDLELLARQTAIPFHVSATRIASGSARLFTGPAVTLDALMASACLPDLFAPVVIDGEDHWDGGFTANPALEPLVFGTTRPTDMIVIQVTPFVSDDLGPSLSDTMRRVSDISFNSCLLRDLKALTEIQAIVRRVPSEDAKLQAVARTNLHLMEASPALGARGAGSKADTRWSSLQELRALGRDTAEAWLARNGAVVGRGSSLQALPQAVAA